MKKQKRTAEAVISTGEDAYFAASNSARGFCSYYRECLDAPRISHVYSVKGGPGTGKSRFLREMAEAGGKSGYRAEYIYCSSDPDSLDGVILSKNGRAIAFADGTAPHLYEPNRVGYREEIINLGVFWDSKKLADHGEEIAEWNRKKQRAYAMAFRYLEGYGCVSENRDSLVEPYLRREKMTHLAKHLLRNCPEGEAFSPQTALIHAVGMKGRVGLDTYFAQAKKIYLVEDCRGSGYRFLSVLYEEIAKKKQTVRVSKDPILTNLVDGLFLPVTGEAIVVGEDCPFPHTRVRTGRFVQTERMHAIRPMLNHAEQMRRAMLDGATEALALAKKAHFALERIYVDAMDFDAKEEFTKRFAESVFQ